MAQRTLSTLPSFPNTIKQENDRSWKAMNKNEQAPTRLEKYNSKCLASSIYVHKRRSPNPLTETRLGFGDLLLMIKNKLLFHNFTLRLAGLLSLLIRSSEVTT